MSLRLANAVDACVTVVVVSALASCAAFMAWNQGPPRVPPPGCVGDLDWEKCGDQCCDNHLGYTCHPGGCEYDGSDIVEGARPKDGGTDGARH